MKRLKSWRLPTVLMILALQTSISMAEPAWTGYGTVEEVYPSSTSVYYVKMSVGGNPSTCSNRIWFFNSGDSAGSDRVFAILLAAQLESRQVKLLVTGACDQWGYSEMMSASMQ